MANLTLAQIETSIPNCSLSCFSTALQSSPDFISNPTSSCQNITVQTPLWACLQRSCTFQEQSQYYATTLPICFGQPIPSRGLPALIEPAVLGPVTLLAVATRLYSRYTISKTFGADDYLILAAGSIYTGTIVLYIFNTTLGFGKHSWNIDPLNIKVLLLIFYIGELSYLTCITLIRLSILFFYLRIFMKRRFRVTVWITIIFVGASGLAFLIAALLQCVPISGVFDRSILSKCLDLNAVAFSNAGIGITQDVIILVLPFPEVIHLTMIARKKIILILMFLLGSFACLTSIIRLKYLKAFATSTDETGDDQAGSLWSFAEESVAIICACMPAIRKLLSNYLPNILNLEPNSSIPQFTTQGGTGPPSLYPISIRSVERRSKTIFTGDDFLRGVRLDEGASPMRWSFDVSAVSLKLSQKLCCEQGSRHLTSLWICRADLWAMVFESVTYRLESDMAMDSFQC
ncbi:hypothetical protein N431DRAFT_550668 [Stipitochalara longipes BDJ]|nr:hypothetical protein N431DRAFT_550668 [Stipitochalara longipes BDJ]